MPIDSSPDLQQPAPVPTRQQLAAQGRTKPGKVTGKLKTAIEAMVWQGLKRREAAQEAHLTEHALYCALARPHVRSYYLGQLELLRTSERSRNIHRLCEIRDAADNMPAVNAIKILEQLDDEQRSRQGVSGHQSPGFVIVINGASLSANDRNPQVIEHEPSDNTGS